VLTGVANESALISSAVVVLDGLLLESVPAFSTMPDVVRLGFTTDVLVILHVPFPALIWSAVVVLKVLLFESVLAVSTVLDVLVFEFMLGVWVALNAPLETFAFIWGVLTTCEELFKVLFSSVVQSAAERFLVVSAIRDAHPALPSGLFYVPLLKLMLSVVAVLAGLTHSLALVLTLTPASLNETPRTGGSGVITGISTVLGFQLRLESALVTCYCLRRLKLRVEEISCRFRH